MTFGKWYFRRRWDAWREWRRVMQGPRAAWEVVWENVHGEFNDGIEGEQEELLLRVVGDVVRRGWFFDRVEYGVTLAETKVRSIRVERNGEFFWHIPKGVSACITVGNPLRVARISTS